MWVLVREHSESQWKETYIENNDKKEINVCYVMELDPDVHRHKSQGCVFCSPDLIPRVLYQEMTLFVSFGFRYRNVEVDFSTVPELRIILAILLFGGLRARCARPEFLAPQRRPSM